MNKTISVLLAKSLLFVLLISGAYAQERIAVVEFIGSGVSNITAKTITNRFSYELSKTKRFEIIEREMMDKMLDEQKFQNSGCVADQCVVEIGQMIGVNRIIAGNVSKIEDFYSLNIRLINVETGKILYQDMADHVGSTKDFMQVTVKNMALKMAAEVTKTNGDSETETTRYTSTKKGDAVFDLNIDNVAIYVDGQYSSRSSGRRVFLSITEGSHTIKFALAGYGTWEKTINIIADEQINYDVIMESSGETQGMQTAVTGILLVRSDPDAATVYVDGVKNGNTLLQITDIGVGEHEIRVEKNLYHPYVELITIAPDVIDKIKAELKANFGSLSITTEPAGAVLKINGQIKGRTPYSISQLKSGSYNFEISKDLYHTHKEDYIITDGSENSRDIRLNPAFGKLIINTSPVAAEVFLDGQNKGTTPFELDELPSGSYHLTVDCDLFQPVEKDIIIEDGKTLDLNLTLEARSGLITITGSPAGADITANGKSIGTIPLSNYRISEGMVELTVSATNHHTHSEFVKVERDKSQSAQIELVHHTGKIIVITEPPEATVFLDDKEMGKSPQILSGIPAGEHTVRVEHPDYATDIKEISLRPNERKEVVFELITYKEQAQDAKIRNKKKIISNGMCIDIDGNKYRTVMIGNQVWTAENLKVTHYRNGDPITTGLSIIKWNHSYTGAYAVYGGKETNADTYGYLYNWYAVDDSRNIAPEGWHVPTDNEWQTLVDYLGGKRVAGGKLKEEGTTHWNSPNTEATNEAGFAALPGGSRYSNGNYYHMGSFGYFWSSTELNSRTAWYRLLDYNGSGVLRLYRNKQYGFSVRCVRD